ncbi:hypothetical protein GCM10023069_29430 [Shinella granuli]
MVDKKRRKRRKDGGKTVQTGNTGGNSIPIHSSAPPVPPVASDVVFDAEKYRHHVAHFDMPDDRKAELLFAVWQIMQSFVDRAFGDDPVQQVLRARHVDSLSIEDESAASSVIGSSETHNKQQRLTSAFRPNAADRRGKEDSSA